MNEEKGKLHTLKDILLSRESKYQGKVRYLAALLYVLIVLIGYCTIYYAHEHMSYQMFQLFMLIVILLLLLWGLAIVRYERQKKGRKT